MVRLSFRSIAFATSLLVGVAGCLWAQPPADYFTAVNRSSGPALRTSLASRLANGATQLGYSNTWEPIKRVWEDPNNTNNVIVIYTGLSVSKAAQCSTNCQDGSYIAGVWSREHLWPQSSFDESEPMRSDLHALAPCDQDLNQARSNSPFGYVANPTNSVLGNQWTSSLFQVRTQDRGDVARAMLYMDVRYNGSPNLTLVENPDISRDAGQSGKLSALYEWHFQDPPSPQEIIRNHRVYNEQGNANPFITHPEWASIIWGPPVTNGNTLTVVPTDIAPDSGTAGQEVALLRLTMTANANQWDLSYFDVALTGTAADFVESVVLYRDISQSGDIAPGDPLIATATVTGGSARVVAAGYRIMTQPVPLLVGVRTATTTPAGATLQMQLVANSVTHATSGGTDINPTISAFTSSPVPFGETPVASQLVISEVMYDPGSSEANPIRTEWVEVLNASHEPVTLTNCYLQDKDGQTGTFTATLQPGEAVVLFPSNATVGEFQAAWGTGFQAIPLTGWGTGGMSNLANAPPEGGEQLTLRNASGAVLSEASYRNGNGWPTANNSASIYLKRDSYRSDAVNIAGNWLRSALGTAGGRANTVTAVFDGSDVGSPGYASIAPGIGAVASDVVEGTPGIVTVDFIDLNDAAPGTFVVTPSALSAGAFTATTVTKPAPRAYRVTLDYTPPPGLEGLVTFSLSVNDGDGAVVAPGLSFTIDERPPTPSLWLIQGN